MNTIKEFWNNRLILKVYSGSISYGTNTPESDIDTRGICIPPASHLLGLMSFEQHESTETDETIYSLKKFIKLALDNNPNIIDALFTSDEHVIFANDYGKELHKLRDHLLSKKIYKTYGGYAIAQLKKMSAVDKNAVGKRAETIAKFGYDTKNALHMIRLLRMGIEILSGQGVNVYRNDRNYLNEIRRGCFTIEQIKNEYARLNESLDEAYNKSSLPDEPNFEMINNWLIDVQKRSLEWNGNN
ncbi:nucleotidyltransferase domain-containing protein [Paenibacillus sp. N1-5-1-14]|uniref:nucleotidyltransferase domain-containing protein n=1 Tax=Paenibacillus radicibacter TaxID=2972488 RepID=UPI0021598A31|nr:nucleotidyltransferase domain-containing protein [Paenibacillus radicibacter]MCR8641370.1 nucleotidyltransferase domain-containing protein [Paenibacillus radicibacter]